MKQELREALKELTKVDEAIIGFLKEHPKSRWVDIVRGICERGIIPDTLPAALKKYTISEVGFVRIREMVKQGLVIREDPDDLTRLYSCAPETESPSPKDHQTDTPEQSSK